MKTVIIIPARQGSTRFPGKPKILIHGKPLLKRVWEIAKVVKHIDGVYVATDNDEIKQLAEGFGAEVLMTPPECENGSIRTFAALQQMNMRPDIAINLQGDAVLTPPWIIQAVVNEIQKDRSIQIATPAAHLNREKYEEFLKLKSTGRTSGTLVVFDRNRNALYFSKGIIPHPRDKQAKDPQTYRHIGLYAYRYPALEKYCSLPASPLEQVEQLEQLRALENGIPIKVVLVDYKGRTPWSVDTPEDVAIVEKIIANEGELL
jgi:3-deoxy-manno-octulosonate cytidylyltransferase (CMP-KDO synthetase)